MGILTERGGRYQQHLQKEGVGGGGGATTRTAEAPVGVFGMMCQRNIITQVGVLQRTQRNPTEKKWGCVKCTTGKEHEPFQANEHTQARFDSTPARV